MAILMYNGGLVSQVALKQVLVDLDGIELGVATPSDVLENVTFSSENGVNISGTIPRIGAWTSTPTESGQILIPEGYHDGTGYVDTTSVYNAGVSAGTKTLASGQGILVKNTTNLLTPASSGSTDKGIIFSWTNTYGAGKIYIYAKCAKGSDSYSSTAISINGTQVHSSAAGTYIGQGVAISNGGRVEVGCQARAGVKEFMVTFIKD